MSVKQEKIRFATQADRILNRLREGSATNAELSAISLKYTGRISDLRKRGYVIDCEKIGGGLTRYSLIRNHYKGE